MEEGKAKEDQVAKKMWKIARVVFFMLRRGISRSRIALDLSLIAKRSNKLAGKAIGNFLTFNGIGRHHNNKPAVTSSSSSSSASFFGCHSGDALSVVSPREYEFSCSNTPSRHNNTLYYLSSRFFPFNKRNHKSKSGKYEDDVTTVAAVQRMLEMLNSHNEMMPPGIQSSSAFVSAAASPLPGFGMSPVTTKQLRITDSPFPVKEEGGGGGGDGQVDKAADEFIKRFYKDLKSQKAVVDQSPYHSLWGR
ncbi:hypothetical protein LINGRAHAP2_LOCUS21456 [Linum grandiflorum]